MERRGDDRTSATNQIPTVTPPAKLTGSLLRQDPAAAHSQQPRFIHPVFCLDQGNVELLQGLCLIIHRCVQT